MSLVSCALSSVSRHETVTIAGDTFLRLDQGRRSLIQHRGMRPTGIPREQAGHESDTVDRRAMDSTWSLRLAFIVRILAVSTA